ncbi:hypothetical protein QCA50_010780 [Cerrena zonata]|uniref:Uncharacterized protein n=1 Tax=Cerrena zonata TaxID=2478898 RepID=A0AAW0G488_9APHY
MPSLEDASHSTGNLPALRYPNYDSDDSDLPLHDFASADPGGLDVFDNRDLLATMFANHAVLGVDGPSRMPKVIGDGRLNSMDVISFSLNEGPDVWAADAVREVIGLLEVGEFGTVERESPGVLRVQLYLYLDHA